jgi:hypothetical protein
MNFEDAVSAHQKWKVRLRMAIDGKSTEKLDPNTVCKDDQCDLGKWIHGEGGQTMGSKPEFGHLKTTHADFHKVAGNVLRKSQAGDKAGAVSLLEGEFFQTSTKVIQAIGKCRDVCN